jgi:hypothetical protein
MNTIIQRAQWHGRAVELVSVEWGGNVFVVVVDRGEPVSILLPGMGGNDDLWGDSLLSHAEKEQVINAALERLIHE